VAYYVLEYLFCIYPGAHAKAVLSAGLEMVACISEQILYLTSVLHSFVDRLITGTGRRLDEVMYLELLMQFRLMEDLLRPICPQSKINLMHLYCVVEKAYMLVPPVIPI
jgi:hypothetical protein